MLVGDASVPFGNRLAVSGRLLELYLQLPDADRYGAKAERMASMGATIVGPDSPLYPKFRHFEAMAMRLSPTPRPGALEENGEAAVMDRDAYQRSAKVSPGEALCGTVGRLGVATGAVEASGGGIFQCQPNGKGLCAQHPGSG